MVQPVNSEYEKQKKTIKDQQISDGFNKANQIPTLERAYKLVCKGEEKITKESELEKDKVERIKTELKEKLKQLQREYETAMIVIDDELLLEESTEADKFSDHKKLKKYKFQFPAKPLDVTASDEAISKAFDSDFEKKIKKIEENNTLKKAHDALKNFAIAMYCVNASEGIESDEKQAVDNLLTDFCSQIKPKYYNKGTTTLNKYHWYIRIY